MDFDLHTLGWKAFQDLCATILSEILGQTVQQFFDSQDGGRDGAFCGTWHSHGSEEFQGNFTVQCKFSAKRDRQLSLSDLEDDLQKARRLAAKGLATTYILMTNCHLMGDTDEQLRAAFLQIPGITYYSAYGSEWISSKIRESSRLRMLVPRIYGLGDLSQILDERAYAQATEILSALGEDFAKFVITDAHRKSAQSLVRQGFVLLLGEPASGKSTIAAALAVASIDEWGCHTLKIRDADDFVRHSNPHEPKQLFWVDDAFGSTQLETSLASDWNRVFPHMNAAIHRGARVIFTSRDYIYRAAMQSLKLTAFPLLQEAQVIIRVEQLSKEEREQILYNHLKLGRQSAEFRTQIKPYLPAIAAMPEFKPETARRLAEPLFTKDLALTSDALKEFVAHPLEHLIEVVRTLDSGSRAALALVFMRGGSLTSPLSTSPEEQRAVQLIGADTASVREALTALNESLVLRVQDAGQYKWQFKHPTVRDAFASLVADDLELLDIYLAGSPPERLITEISCGDVGIQGVKVIIPRDRYDKIIDKLTLTANGQPLTQDRLYRFLSQRCDRLFLEAFIWRFPSFIESLKVWSYLYAVADVDVICRLHEFGLLPETKRLAVVGAFAELAIQTPDDGFLSKRCSSLFQGEELKTVLTKVREELLNDLESVIENWRNDFPQRESDDPDEYFYPLIETLKKYQEEFTEDPTACTAISGALVQIEDVVQELREDKPTRQDDYYDDSDRSTRRTPNRSVFDDIDQ